MTPTRGDRIGAMNRATRLVRWGESQGNHWLPRELVAAGRFLAPGFASFRWGDRVVADRARAGLVSDSAGATTSPAARPAGRLPSDSGRPVSASPSRDD